MLQRLTLVISISLFLFSCGVGSENVNENDTQGDIEEEILNEVNDDDKESIEEEPKLEDNTFILPSAFHISSLLQRAGLTFEDGVCNDPGNVNLYSSKNAKLLNFGIYSADLFFNVFKDQNDVSKKYIKVLKQLSEETGMGAVFNSESILERFEKNIENKDSVLFLVLEIEERTDMYIERTNEEHTAMVIFTGAWLEGMYMGLKSHSDSKSEELARRLFEQACLLENIVEGMQNHPDEEPYIKKVSSELEKIFTIIRKTEAFSKGDYGLVETPIPYAELERLSNELQSFRNRIILNKIGA